jgi:hypothetical protein
MRCPSAGLARWSCTPSATRTSRRANWRGSCPWDGSHTRRATALSRASSRSWSTSRRRWSPPRPPPRPRSSSRPAARDRRRASRTLTRRWGGCSRSRPPGSSLTPTTSFWRARRSPTSARATSRSRHWAPAPGRSSRARSTATSCCRCCATIGRPSSRCSDEVHGENVRAYVTFDPDADPPTAQELIRFARSEVGYKAPEEIVALDEFPLTATGKVDRVLLKRMAEPG